MPEGFPSSCIWSEVVSGGDILTITFVDQVANMRRIETMQMIISTSQLCTDLVFTRHCQVMRISIVKV